MNTQVESSQQKLKVTSRAPSLNTLLGPAAGALADELFQRAQTVMPPAASPPSEDSAPPSIQPLSVA
jgi:hypothetical protein